jgi:hypothetical protein
MRSIPSKHSIPKNPSLIIIQDPNKDFRQT